MKYYNSQAPGFVVKLNENVFDSSDRIVAEYLAYKKRIENEVELMNQAKQ